MLAFWENWKMAKKEWFKFDEIQLTAMPQTSQMYIWPTKLSWALFK
jgi:hypothetical protein